MFAARNCSLLKLSSAVKRCHSTRRYQHRAKRLERERAKLTSSSLDFVRSNSLSSSTSSWPLSLKLFQIVSIEGVKSDSFAFVGAHVAAGAAPGFDPFEEVLAAIDTGFACFCGAFAAWCGIAGVDCVQVDMARGMRAARRERGRERERGSDARLVG